MNRTLLIAGDVLALAIVTVIGFATHGETDLSLLPRMLTTFLPLLVGWFIFAVLLQLFRVENVSSLKQLWRPVAAMLLAAPLVTTLRALMLNGVSLPIFTIVLGATSTFGMLLWRAAYLLYLKKARTL